MNLIVHLLSLFIIAQLLGIFTGVMIFNDMIKNPYVSAFVITKDSQDLMNAVYFFLYVILGAVFFIFIIKFYFADLIFKFIELFLISVSSSIVFYSFLRLSYSYESSMIIGILLGVLIAVAKFFLPSIKNFTTILAAAGIGAIFGLSLGVIPVILFLFLLSIYDYIAVFKTGHMIEMAKFMMKKELSFTITVCEIIPKTKKEARINLGSGDVLAPIMLEVSALQISYIASIFVFLGAVISLMLFLFLIFKKNMILPALPPITFGMILFLISGKIAGLY